MNTTKSVLTTCERLSALADGELGHEDLPALLDACRADDAAAGQWGSYHLIGEVLRAPASGVRAASPDFLKRLNQRLAQELPLPGAPVVPDGLASPAKDTFLIHHPGDSANDGNFRWKMVAGFASLTAVAAIAWTTFGTVVVPPGEQLAQAPSAALAAQQVLVVESPQGLMVRDARLEELLAAHRQLGGASALQAPSGFLNAAFETPQNAGR
ncbi:MAG: sigma-E factor negative regulatory protein [Pseudomonadota bacterium]